MNYTMIDARVAADVWRKAVKDSSLKDFEEFTGIPFWVLRDSWYQHTALTDYTAQRIGQILSPYGPAIIKAWLIQRGNRKSRKQERKRKKFK